MQNRSEDMTIKILDEFEQYLKKQGKSDKTINSYLRSVSLFFSQSGALNVAALQSFRNYLLKHYRLSTVNTRIHGLNCYLGFLKESNRLPSCLCSNDNPANIGSGYETTGSGNPGRVRFYKLPPVKEQRRSYFDTVISQDDYEALKQGLKKDENYYWYYVIRFLGGTGARISELLQIKIEDLQLGYLDIYTKGGKIRRLYLPRTLCNEAIPYFESKGVESGFIFLNRRGNLITPRGVELQLKHLAKIYHINPVTVYPHSFRHRYAKNFLERFNDISLLADLLGHDSIETTRLYLTRSSQEQKELLDRIVTW